MQYIKGNRITDGRRNMKREDKFLTGLLITEIIAITICLIINYGSVNWWR